MLLYHGTISTCAENIINNGINISKGNKSVDFGQGFYTTPSIRFAMNTALNKAFKTNVHYDYEYCKPVVLSFKYCPNNNLRVLTFYKRDIKWAQFIINNRNGFTYLHNTRQNFHNLTGYFDIVSGEIADNKITAIAQELSLLNEKLSGKDFINMIYQYKTSQYSFHTEKSLSCLELISCDIIEEKKGGIVNE